MRHKSTSALCSHRTQNVALARPCTGHFSPSVQRPICLTLSPVTFDDGHYTVALFFSELRGVLGSGAYGAGNAVSWATTGRLCAGAVYFALPSPWFWSSCVVCQSVSCTDPVSEDEGLSPSVSSGAIVTFFRTSVSKGLQRVKCLVETHYSLSLLRSDAAPSPVFQHVPSDVTTGSCLLFLCLHCWRQTLPLRRFLTPAHYFWAPRRKHLYCWCQTLARQVPRFLSELVLCTRWSFSRELFWQAEHASAPNASTAQKCCTAGLILVGLKRTWDQKLSSGLMWPTFLTTHLFQFRFADTGQYWLASWLITVTFFWTGNKHVPLAPNCRVLKNPVWCGFHVEEVHRWFEVGLG